MYRTRFTSVLKFFGLFIVNLVKIFWFMYMFFVVSELINLLYCILCFCVVVLICVIYSVC